MCIQIATSLPKTDREKVILMRWLCGLRGSAFWLALFSLLTAGCSSPAQPRPDSVSQADQRQVPFQDGESPQGRASPDRSEGSEPESSLPFRDSQGLPAGMLLTVLLRDPICAGSPGASGTFGAVVDEPVVVEGTILLPRGATVAGRIESAHASQLKRDRGYVQLTLASIAIGGQEIPIQTSSLFVNGNAIEARAVPDDSSLRTIRVESGRRLTFRLIEPVLLASKATVSAR